MDIEQEDCKADKEEEHGEMYQAWQYLHYLWKAPLFHTASKEVPDSRSLLRAAG